jgi:RNA polymerase sigma factor (sigma-70 family)
MIPDRFSAPRSTLLPRFCSAFSVHRSAFPTVSESIHNFTAALAAGDPAAVEAFYRGYFDTLYAHARQATGRDEAFCLDVVQESVLRIIRSVRAAHSQAQFNAWLKLVVRTAAYDLLRSESRRRKREWVMAATAPEASAGDETSDQERMQWLRMKIAAMDEQIVRIIEMRFERRWTLARIAQAFGLTIGTVDGRLRRALADLRCRATEEFDE